MENEKPNPKLKLKFILWFKPAKLEQSLAKVLSNREFQGLKDAKFPLRSNCQVKLYHDAHHCPTFHPPFDPCGTPKNLWEDVFKAIEGAKYIVYIAAWSLNPMMVLVSECLNSPLESKMIQ
jgi:phospholipase D1/2